MRHFRGIRMLVGAALLASTGCGGDEAGKNLKASGGGDVATQAAMEAQQKPADKSDANFSKTANGEKRNTARDPGVSSGGATSSAVLD